MNLKQHRASLAGVGEAEKRRAEGWELESERRAESGTHKGLWVVLKMSAFLVNRVGIRFGQF